jgi:ribosomal protein S27AE
MKNGTCPSCGASSVYASVQGIIYSGKGVYIQNIGETVLVPTPYESFVCTKCGYFENHIIDQAKLATIEHKWKKAE